VHFTGTRFLDRHAPAPRAGRYWSEGNPKFRESLSEALRLDEGRHKHADLTADERSETRRHATAFPALLRSC
jgi:hypothetical protein